VKLIRLFALIAACIAAKKIPSAGNTRIRPPGGNVTPEPPGP